MPYVNAKLATMTRDAIPRLGGMRHFSHTDFQRYGAE